MQRSSFRSIDRASRHPIVSDRPAPNFFQGALLGNGGLGVVLTTRPDAVVLHFGHNSVWDIRVAEEHTDQVGTFQEIFERVKAIPAHYSRLDEDPWYRQYCDLMGDNYTKPYPRPFPCGSLVLGFDPRQVELLGHRLDIASGVCAVRLLHEQRIVTLECFVDMLEDRVWLRLVDEAGTPIAAPFERVRLLPDPDGLLDDTPDEASAIFSTLPNDRAAEPGPASDDQDEIAPGLFVPTSPPEGSLAFRQVLPYLVRKAGQPQPSHPEDRAFRLTVQVNSTLKRERRINWHGVVEQMPVLERALHSHEPFLACVQLDHGLASSVADEASHVDITYEAFATAASSNRSAWEMFWDKSGVALEDEQIERLWYHNLYFFNCAVRPGVTCPGLFANWSYQKIGTAWHGDYHLNYNTQQPFWVAFSSNHADKHLPYVDLVHRVLPLSRSWAQEYYGLRGAYFPHSAYPVEMKIMPYPVPTWGWEICETPWMVQSLWWHYLYTMDRAFLEQQAFGPIKEAVQFLVDYMRRPEAHGEQWNDERYHIFPTVVPELYGLTPGLSKNHDCLVDLTLTKFIFLAFLQACEVLERNESEGELCVAVAEILAHFPDYPTAESRLGSVFVSVEGEHAETVYNVPIAAITVFPGEEDGLHSTAERRAILSNTYHNQRIEGGNQLVMANLQGARLGLLDLERFKRDVAYCLLPNGTCTDMVQQVHGRYQDRTAYDFMGSMGIWFENFALPAVVNECLLQSYNGVLRFFPNWPADRRAEFRTLRAAGAFLVSAAWEHGEVQWIEITSEAGAPLQIYVPWQTGAHCIRAAGTSIVVGETAQFTTTIGETIRFVKA